MAIQVNIFEAGSVPTAQELVTLINELNTTLDESVTLTGEQSITGVKTFLGSKLLKFKQKITADKLGFTFYDNQGKEVGNFEYDNKNNFRLLALGNYYSAANQEIEGYVGFKVYNKSALSAYRLLCPLAGNAKNSIPSLTDTYTNFYMPLVFVNGAASVTADNTGKVDLSTLIGSGGGSGDISDLATVATTGDYNDLLNRPILFSGNYNDLTNKPTLFSGSYGDLTDKPTLFSGDYNDLTNKPTIPVVDLTKAQADELYQPKGNYALTEDLFSGSYNDLTDKPSLFSGNYNDLTNKPALFSGSYNDLTDKPTLFSGSYNDLSDKPTIPTVPTISTNITSDAASNTKTASPKAVKDFVEGKGYLTEHQDISGKADQTDLEALEDRVEALEQSGSSTTIDTKLSSISTNSVQNKTLYDELRVEGTGESTFTTEEYFTIGDEMMYDNNHKVLPIEIIDIAQLEVVTDNTGYNSPVYKLPTLSQDKAYILTGFDFTIGTGLRYPFSFSNVGNFVLSIDCSSGSTGPTFCWCEYLNSSGSGISQRSVVLFYNWKKDGHDKNTPMPFIGPLTKYDFVEFPVGERTEGGYIIYTGKYLSGDVFDSNISLKTKVLELEARVEVLEQAGSGGGDTTQYSYLKLIDDLDAYTEAPVGEIVKFVGKTDKYTRGWDYEKVSDTPQSRAVTSIVYTDDVPEALKQAVDSLVFPLLYDNEQVPVYYFSLGSTIDSPRFASIGTKTPAVGDLIFACDGSGVYHVTNAYTANSKYNIYIDHPTFTSNYVLNLNKTFFKWHDSNGNVVLLRHMESASGSGYNLTNEDVFIEKDNVMYFGSDNGKTKAAYNDVQIPLWQPIIHPTAPVSSGD